MIFKVVLEGLSRFIKIQRLSGASGDSREVSELFQNILKHSKAFRGDSKSAPEGF